MDEISILKQVLTQGPFAALFVWLLWSTKRDASQRETKLMDHIERMGTQFEHNTSALQQIERSLSGLENDLKEVWNHIERKRA